VSSDFDDVRPISAPNDGPDPRIEAPTAPLTGPDPRTSQELPEPDGDTDVRDLDPSPPVVPDPGFGGLAPMGPADTAPPSAAVPSPAHPVDVRDLDPSPGNPDPGFASGGLQPMTAADAGGPQGHALETPDRPVDVRDLDPAPGYSGTGGGDPGSGIQTMSGGGSGGGMQSNSMSGVEDPAALNRAGQAANELASVVQSSGMVGEEERMWGAVGSLAGDLWGGELGAELSKTMESWDRQAEKLKRTCVAIGERCTQTASNYTTTESANESEMNSVSNSLADFN